MESRKKGNLGDGIVFIFYISTDGGNTWTATSMTAVNRAQIAVTRDNANYVYFFSKDKGLYLSTNSGTSTPGTAGDDFLTQDTRFPGDEPVIARASMEPALREGFIVLRRS